MESSPSSGLEAAAAAAIGGICSRSAAPVEVTMANSCSSQERLGDETMDSSCTGTCTGGSEVHVIVPRTPEEHQAFLQTQRQVQTIEEEEEKCEEHQDLQAAVSSSTTSTDHESAKSKSNLIPPSKQQPRGKTPAKRGLRKNGSSESDSSSAEMMVVVPLPAMRGLRKNSYTCTDRRISDHNHHLPREETADVNANLSFLEELASGVEPLPVEPAAPALLRNSTHNYRQSLPGAFAQMPGVAFSQQPNTHTGSAEHHDDDDHHRNSTCNTTVETASATTEGLVQARQVTDDELESSSQLQQARAVTARQLKLQQKHRQQQSSYWQNKPACGILSVVLAGVVVAILLGVGLAAFLGNDIVGTIPSHLGLFPVLADLRLHNNPHLSGSLPTELGMLTRMMQLDLSNLPLLTGTIPSELALLTANLSYLNFTGSHGLSGPISSELCSLLNKNCSYKPLPWDPGYELPCALEFDCRPTEGLCGCDCPCSDNTL
ncbi:expressed unknown protein [Seminavis robusta]|uniref:Uncharacterized protein n=1 Tax=Seminavis robusta TaxID=568900 RepID=A0A9N8F055_9STRA|nr:expressed unknown protein [Seminavis robusta]|eukprot:Sro2745_g336090.1 n/a (489) ;mRNA; f:7574-9661